MKKIFFLISLPFLFTQVKGQTFTFESNYTNCKVDQGTLSLSSDHFKEGSQSLCWQTNGGQSQLTFSGFSVLTSSTNCANMQIYSPAITNDTIYVDFLYNNDVKKSGRYLMNYKGWHEFKRWYSSYQNSSSAQINTVRFTLHPTDQKSRNIYIDNVILNETINTQKDILGSHWVLDFDVLAWVGARLDPHYLKDPYRLYGNKRDIPLKTPTTEELNVLKQLRSQCDPNLKYYVGVYNTAIDYVNSLGLTRNADQTIKGGTVISNKSTDISLSTLIGDSKNKGILEHLKALAAAITKKSNAQTYFNLLFDYVIDQGLGEGCPIFASSNAYDDVRNLTGLWYQALSGCKDDARYQECLKAMKWYSYYGAMYNPENSYLYCINSDVLYLLTQPIMNAITSEKEDAVAVRELYAFQRYINRSVRDVPGGNNMIKSDGTGFHHATHYINYMRAYGPVTDAMYWLKGSPFKVDPESYKNFRKAILAYYSFATKHEGDNHSYALSLAGRHPFSSNHNLSYSKDRFENLIAVGRDCMNLPHDTLLENAYNYYFKSTKYDVPSTSLEGFYAYNYSPVGIYRGDTWQITMRCPTTKFWGAEIYPSTNRYGRYQSHGTLDVNYDGDDFSASGYPTNDTGAGWDWNCPSGATTVHYVDWKSLSPAQNISTRLDQYNENDFSGALAFDQVGMFGCKFLQREKWTTTGNNVFPTTSTYLTFQKSMFCFDQMVIALGSDIQTSGSYPTTMLTATTLFQEIITDETASLYLNGDNKSKGFSQVFNSQDHVILTPHGTGFIVPKANDQLKVQYLSQISPKKDGSDINNPTGSLTAVKAYLMHGYKGSSAKQYQYVMKPHATVEEMKDLSTKLNAGQLYTVKAQNSKLHAIHYFPQNTDAYCFFEGVSDLDFGILKSTTSQHLLMIRQDDERGIYTVAIANPNLNPTTDTKTPYNFQWLSNDSQTVLTFDGIFTLETSNSNVKLVSTVNNQTRIQVTMTDGKSSQFRLIKEGVSAVSQPQASATWRYSIHDGFLSLINEQYSGPITIDFFNLQGKKISSENHYIEQNLTIPVSFLDAGIYLCHLTMKDSKTHFKIVI